MDFAHAFFHETYAADASPLRWRVRNTFLDFYVDHDDDECSPSNAVQNGKGLRRRSESVDTCRTGSTQTYGDTTANASTRTSSPPPTPPVGCRLSDPESKPSTGQFASHDCRQTSFSQLSNNGTREGKINATCITTTSGAVCAGELASCNFTTAMIRNIACRYNTEDVKMLLDRVGFQGKYDYVRVPMKCTRSKTTSNLGYCFVNFIDPCYMLEFAEVFKGRRFGIGESQSKKLCDVSLAKEQLTPQSIGQLQGECHREVKDHTMFVVDTAESQKVKSLKPTSYDSNRKYDQHALRNPR